MPESRAQRFVRGRLSTGASWFGLKRLRASWVLPRELRVNDVARAGEQSDRQLKALCDFTIRRANSPLITPH